MSVWSLLERRAVASGPRVFVEWHPFDGPQRSLTYAAFLEEASGLAAGLVRRGVRPGDRVLIHMDNAPEMLTAWFACAATGAVAVTTNTRSAVDEIAYYATHSGVVGAVTQQQYAGIVADAAPELRWLAVAAETGGFPDLAGDPAALDPVPPDPLAPMSIQYTSGTTSRPKGVLWTHANALWGARVNAAHEDLHPDDCHLVYMPLFHANALSYSMLATLWVGARMVLVPKWSTSRFWDISREHGCTWLSLIGPSIRTLATTEPPPDHTYRLFGGPFCDMRLHAGLGDIKTIGWWGMTETISQCIVGDPYLPNRPLSMGRPAPEYGISVVRDDGTAVEPGEAGHLLVKGIPGLSLFAGYWDDPAATQDSFDERGWFRTGDLVTPLPDGHIVFTDRAKDMLKVGGENVAASEIERVLLTVPGVVEAAVVAQRDRRLDEVPVAFVVTTAAADGVVEQSLDACRRLLADFKVPRAVHAVRELPRSTLRKVNKAELRRVADGDGDVAAAERRWVEEGQLDPSGDVDRC